MQSSMESQSITIMCSTQCHLTPHPKTGKYFIQPLGIGIDAAGKSTEHDDAANLVTQACSGHHLDKLREPDMTAFGSTVELRLNASSDCTAREGAIISEHNRGLRASETRLVACAIAFNARHKACVGYALAVHESSSPAMRTVMAGRVYGSARTRGILCGAELDVMGK
jgi:hypothetical protein